MRNASYMHTIDFINEKKIKEYDNIRESVYI